MLSLRVTSFPQLFYLRNASSQPDLNLSFKDRGKAQHGHRTLLAAACPRMATALAEAELQENGSTTIIVPDMISEDWDCVVETMCGSLALAEVPEGVKAFLLEWGFQSRGHTGLKKEVHTGGEESEAVPRAGRPKRTIKKKKHFDSESDTEAKPAKIKTGLKKAKGKENGRNPMKAENKEKPLLSRLIEPVLDLQQELGIEVSIKLPEESNDIKQEFYNDIFSEDELDFTKTEFDVLEEDDLNTSGEQRMPRKRRRRNNDEISDEEYQSEEDWEPSQDEKKPKIKRRRRRQAKPCEQTTSICSLCNCSTNSLAMHYSKTHPEVKPVRCPDFPCKILVYPQRMEQHSARHAKRDAGYTAIGMEEKVKCAVCSNMLYPFQKVLQNHYKNDHDAGSYEEAKKACEICKSWASPEILPFHEERHRMKELGLDETPMDREGKSVVPCLRCGRYVRSEVFQAHKEHHNKCTERQLGYNAKAAEKKQHQPDKRTEKKMKKERVPCPECGRLFLPEKLSVHMDMYHLSPEEMELKKEIMEHTRLNAKEEMTICHKCADDVPASSYKSHVKKCKGKPRFSERMAIFLKHFNKDDPTLCPIPGCGLRYASLEKVKSHYAVVHCKIPCPTCGELFAGTELRNHSLKMHQKLSGDASRAVTCDECDKVFGYKYLLKQHKDEVHNLEDKYFCETCGVGFKTSRKLSMHKYEKHIRGNRSYYCELCGMTNRNIKTVLTHMKNEHSVVTPKDYRPPLKTPI